MKLLDLISRKNTKETLEHKVNPVNDTAKDCLINLVHADCKEALLVNNELKFTDKTNVGSSIDKGTALFQESRYCFVNNAIEKSGFKNILDIGCGYSPRGILFSQKGYHYVGADLPATIKEIEPAVKNCLGNTDTVHYVAVDATNPESLMEAASYLSGPIAIVSEGLFMYLPTYELNEYLKGLKMILEAHDGCIITPDFCMNRLFKTSVSAVSHKLIGDLLQKLAGKIVKQYTVPANNQMDPSVWYSVESDEEPYKYFSSKGFSIERIPVYNSDIHINSFKYIGNAKRKNLLDTLESIRGWKLTI